MKRIVPFNPPALVARARIGEEIPYGEYDGNVWMDRKTQTIGCFIDVPGRGAVEFIFGTETQTITQGVIRSCWRISPRLITAYYRSIFTPGLPDTDEIICFSITFGPYGQLRDQDVLAILAGGGTAPLDRRFTRSFPICTIQSAPSFELPPRSPLHN